MARAGESMEVERGFVLDVFEWPIAVRQIRIAGYRAIVLRDSAELAAEGEAMRNCVGSYTANCMGGVSLVISLRYRDGRRAATLCIVRTRSRPRWTLEEARLKHNRPVGPELERVAQRVAIAYERHHARQPPEPLSAADGEAHAPAGPYLLIPGPGGRTLVPDPEPVAPPTPQPQVNPGWCATRARVEMEQRAAEEAVHFLHRWRRST
jgi:hypothetical protein